MTWALLPYHFSLFLLKSHHELVSELFKPGCIAAKPTETQGNAAACAPRRTELPPLAAVQVALAPLLSLRIVAAALLPVGPFVT
jgi:hypothetical protein